MQVVSLSLFAVFASTPVAGLTTERVGKNEPDQVAELLLNAGLEELAADNSDWAVRELWRDGFAQSESVAQRVATGLGGMHHLDLRQRLAKTLAADHLQQRAVKSARGQEVAYDIPLAKHPLVDRYIKHFSGRGRWFFARWLTRAERYIPVMQPILAEKGVPLDTVYLAMIESGFSAHAYSRAAAGGFWQFIPSTGRLYRLRQDTWVDERRDFIKATHSAANYLTHLYAEFKDWHLAWAAYNAGGGRVRRALARHQVNDFWALLARRRSLAKETQHYVPKIIAAAIVAKNRERYGFFPEAPPPPLIYDEVEVTDAVALKSVAQQIGVSLAELATLNPALRFQITPPRRAYRLRVPAGKGETISTWLARVPATERTDFRQHVVRRGDTLWRIAARYRSTITALKEFNGIKNPKVLRVGQRLIVPTLGGTKKTKGQKAGRKKPPKRRKASKPVAQHVVSRGETLWSISQRYQVSIAQLRTWNDRHTNTIGVGEILKIF